VLLDTVTGIDISRRCVEVSKSESVPYDYLIVASGATHSYFGNDAWEEDAPGLKTIEDALEIRRRILLAFEEAERSTDPAERARLLTFVVVGAGPTGVELAGAIAEIATTTLTRDFRMIDPAATHVVLVEGGERVLTALSPRLSRKAAYQLEALGVDVRLSTIVSAIDDHGVDTTTGRIDSGCVLWAAGVSASPLGALIGVETDRAGRVPVTADLSIPGDSDVFVIGDLATVPWKGGVVPGVAPAAMQQGRHVASLIEADLAGRRRSPFEYRDKGTLATIGRSSAVASIGRIEFWGFTAWMLWWSIHIAYLIGFRSRVFVLFGWGWSWFTQQRSARLITNPWRPSGPDEP
jgi:NADH dehydrogenase